jgi:hypothetical protein
VSSGVSESSLGAVSSPVNENMNMPRTN